MDETSKRNDIATIGPSVGMLLSRGWCLWYILANSRCCDIATIEWKKRVEKESGSLMKSHYPRHHRCATSRML